MPFDVGELDASRRAPGRSLSVVQDLRNEIRSTRNNNAVSEIDQAITGVRSWRQEQAARVAAQLTEMQAQLDAEPLSPPAGGRPSPSPPRRPARRQHEEGDENGPPSSGSAAGSLSSGAHAASAALRAAAGDRTSRADAGATQRLAVAASGAVRVAEPDVLQALDDQLARLNAKFGAG